MFFLLILILFITCLALYLLFAPLVLEVNTHNNLYRFAVLPVFSIRWVYDVFPGHPEISICGFKRKLDLFQQKDKAVQKKKRKKDHQSFFKPSFQGIKAVVKSFRVKRWLVNIDTGDMALNGVMYPLMYILTRITRRTFTINFLGKNEIIITIHNNAFRMLKAYIFNK